MEDKMAEKTAHKLRVPCVNSCRRNEIYLQQNRRCKRCNLYNVRCEDYIAGSNPYEELEVF